MEKVKIGKIIDGVEERDAIHIAIYPVVADMLLSPGEHIGFVNNNGKTVATNVDTIGIVDPFLTEPVKKGQRFYMFLYPNTITSLRHNWTHPEIQDEDFNQKYGVNNTFHLIKTHQSRVWLENFAIEHELSYEELMDSANTYLRTGTYKHLGTDIAYGDMKDFWQHYGKVHDVDLPEDMNDSFFTCSC